MRIGNQIPTLSVILPYTKTQGPEAVELYNLSGNTAQEWQELMLSDIMAKNDDVLWVHTKFGYSVPRRNGKTEILTDESYLMMLESKLDEELAEYHKDQNIEELADIYEVIRALAEAKGYTVDELESVRAKKHEERGGFKEKILLIETEYK